MDDEIALLRRIEIPAVGPREFDGVDSILFGLFFRATPIKMK